MTSIVSQLSANNPARSAIGGIPEWSEQFVYDPMGNRLGYDTAVDGAAALQQGRQYNVANQLLRITDALAPTATQVQPGYDLNGNMTTMPSVADWTTAQTLTWDAWNRPVEISEGGSPVVSFGYDGLSRRITRSVDGGEERHFYYSDQWQVLEERTTSSGTERQFVWGAKSLDDLVLRDVLVGTEQLSERTWALNDGKNITAAARTIEAGSPVAPAELIQRYAYQAYGQPEFLDADFAPDAPASYPDYLFCGYRWDQLTGLYQVRYRYYHPNLGTWLSRDPIEELGGANLYGYVGNGPLQSEDSLGTWPTGLFGTENVHGNAIDRSFPFLRPQTRAVLKKQQVEADQDQSAAGSYKHAMCDGISGQTPEEARKKANAYVREQLTIARKECKNGFTLAGLKALGNAIHTMQDATSPCHVGFQPWDGGKDKIKAANHGLKENFDPGKQNSLYLHGCALDAATKAVWDYFSGVKPMPDDFFGFGSDSNRSLGTDDITKNPF